MIGIFITIFVVIVVVATALKLAKMYKSDTSYKLPAFVKEIVKAIGILIIGLLIINLIGDSFTFVPTGYRGVVLKFGAITPRVMKEGLNFKTPWVEKVALMSVQIRAFSSNASAASKDLQTVSTKITLNYTLEENKVSDIYRLLRNDYEKRIITPAIQEVIKAATAKFAVEELITKRAEVRDEIVALLKERLDKHYIVIDAVSITDFDFSPEFNKAIEKKMVAVEESKTAKNELEKVKFQMQQKVEAAKAEAEALRLQNQQVTEMVLELRRIENERAWIQKWDGKSMPHTIVSGSDGNIGYFLNGSN